MNIPSNLQLNKTYPRRGFPRIPFVFQIQVFFIIHNNTKLAWKAYIPCNITLVSHYHRATKHMSRNRKKPALIRSPNNICKVFVLRMLKTVAQQFPINWSVVLNSLSETHVIEGVRWSYIEFSALSRFHNSDSFAFRSRSTYAVQWKSLLETC